MLDLRERSGIVSRPWLSQYDPGVPATLRRVLADEERAKEASCAQ